MSSHGAAKSGAPVPARGLRAALLLAFAIAGCSGPEAEGDVARVAVAANFVDVARALAERFTAETGREVRLTTGSTGQLHAQIVQGAPFDVFLAADPERPRLLEEEGLAVVGSRATYATGRLVLLGSGGGPVTGPEGLRAGRWRHLAIANPRTAPYGAAALQTLGALGVDTGGARLVRGESVGQVLQFVRTGAADAGFVALAQVRTLPSEAYWRVPATLHDPIRQDLVLLARGADNATARAFVAFLARPASRELIRAWGYDPPGEDP